MMTSRKELGDKGEQLAEEYLKRQKYKILDRNFRTRFGEIDIVARDRGQLVFVEVKTKGSHEFGLPEEEFTFYKKRRLRRVIQSWLWKNEIESDNWRVDLIALDYTDSPEIPEIRHHKAVSL
jgi:putative endonuclease